jgi:YesN/AraC family two-component response regulator
MPRLDKETKERIKKLEIKELQEIVLKLASKEKSVYDYVFAHYLDKEFGEKELFETAKADLEILFGKRYKGYAEELQIANMLGACIKRVNEFTKISKNKTFEADLLLHILEIPFTLTTDLFGTCFTQYDTKVAMIVKRLINVVTKKLHEDYRIEYEETINDYLQILHRTSSHNDTVCKLPKAI